MTNELKNIDKLFRKGMADAIKSPPPYVWDRIEASVTGGKKNKKVLHLWMAAASVALIVSFSAGYYLALKNNTEVSVSEMAQIKHQPEKSISGTPSIMDNIIENNLNVNTSENKDKNVKTLTAINISDKKVSDNIVVVTHENSAEIKTHTIEFKAKPAEPVVPSLAAFKLFIYDSNLLQKNIEELFIPESKKIKISKFKIGTNISPVIAYRDIINQGSNFYDLANASNKSFTGASYESDRNYYNEVETPRLTFSGGISAEMAVNNHFSVSTGVNYCNYGYKSNELYVFEDNADKNAIINSSAGDVNIYDSRGSLLDELSNEPKYFIDTSQYYALYISPSDMKVSLSYLETPLFVHYYLSGENNSFYFSIGIAPSVMVNNSVKLSESNLKIGNTSKLKIFNAATIGGFGYSLAILNDKLKLNFEPQFRYMLSPMSKLDYIRSFPYSFSLNTSLQFNF